MPSSTSALLAPLPLRLGMARLSGGAARLVAPLPGDEDRLVDLCSMEAARLRRLGEGAPEVLAAALVPPNLGAVLAGGPRAMARARQALAYAAKWHRRGDLPARLAPPASQAELLPCLGRPERILGWDGRRMKAQVDGPGATLTAHPQPTLAAVGMAGGGPAGFCLALPETGRLILGAWVVQDPAWQGRMILRLGAHQRSAPLDAWAGLGIGELGPGDVVLLPPPRLRRFPDPEPGPAEVVWPWEALRLRVEGHLDHPTVQ